MYNVSSVGMSAVSAYNSVSKNRKTQSSNPFFQEDSFSISDDAMILSAALSEVKASLGAEMSKIDEEKIHYLKQQIEAGKYSVTGHDVAMKLLS